MNPGPATSMARTPAAAASMRPASSSAIWRGARRSGFARVRATLVAQSPCSGLRGRSRVTAASPSTPMSRSTRRISACSFSTGIFLYSLFGGLASLFAAGFDSDVDDFDSEEEDDDEPPPPSACAAFLYPSPR